MTDAPDKWQQLGEAVSLLDERPQLRLGLEAVEQTTRRGVTFHVLRNPAAATYVKLTPEESRLLPLLDGAHTIRDIVVADYELTGVVDVARVAGLVRQLRAQSFLLQPPRDLFAELGRQLRGHSAASIPGRLGRAFIQQSFATTRADPFFGWLYRKGGWLCFTRPVALFGVLCGILGPVFFVAEFARGRYPLFRAGDSYLLGFVLFGALESITLLVHESGHALAAKHAHRFVPRAGIMLYYGFTAAFVDTTDVWMAPRRARLLTSFAGPWTGLVIGGVAATTAFALPQGPLGGFLYAWSFVCVLNTLFNFVPFLELDGYYFFIDIVEQPMLRTRSLAFLRKGLWERLATHTRLTPEERLLLAFGLASAVVTAVMLGLALRFWEVRTWPTLVEAWDTQWWPLRAGLLLAASIAMAVVAASLWRGLVAFRSKALTARARFSWRRWRYRGQFRLLSTAPGLSHFQPGRLLDLCRVSEWVTLRPGEKLPATAGPGLALVEAGRLESSGCQFGRSECLDPEPFWSAEGSTAVAVALESSRVLRLSRSRCSSLLAAEFVAEDRLSDVEPYRAILADAQPFRGLNEGELDLVLASGRLFDVPPGPLAPLEDSATIVVVAAGAVEVGRPAGKSTTFGPGDAIRMGEMGDLVVRAAVPTVLYKMPASRFHDIVQCYLGRDAIVAATEPG